MGNKNPHPKGRGIGVPGPRAAPQMAGNLPALIQVSSSSLPAHNLFVVMRLTQLLFERRLTQITLKATFNDLFPSFLPSD